MRGKISPDKLDYARRREVQERTAAKQALSIAAPARSPGTGATLL